MKNIALCPLCCGIPLLCRKVRRKEEWYARASVTEKLLLSILLSFTPLVSSLEMLGSVIFVPHRLIDQCYLLVRLLPCPKWAFAKMLQEGERDFFLAPS